MGNQRQRQQTKMKPADVAYAAGLFDGEGTLYIGISRNKHWLFSVSLVNTNREVIDWLQDTFGGRTYTRQPRNTAWVTKHEWYMFGTAGLEFLRLISPFVIVKRDDVALGIAFAETLRSDNKPLTAGVTETRTRLLGEIRQLRRLRRATETKSGNSQPVAEGCDSPVCNDAKVAEVGGNVQPLRRVV